MIIKKAVYKKVKKTVSEIVSDDVYGCDYCKKEIKEFPNESSRLEVTVWPEKNSEPEHYHFCSWGCVLKFTPRIQSTYFASFPFLYFDDNGKRSAKEFIKLITKK